MIHRPFDPATIYQNFANFGDWQTRANDGLTNVRTAIAGHQKPDFKSEIYGALKPYLLEWFFGKCAYCESNVDATGWGDVEHYRPKRKVEEEPAHGGYYWLAYDPSNLLPSCQKCNQGQGKMNHFPVVPSTRAFNELAVPSEVPLLLSPYLHRPGEHLIYDFDEIAGEPTGFVKPKPGSEVGRSSIDVYKLNRARLVELRLEAQRATINSYEIAKNKGRLDEFNRKLNALTEPYIGARVSALRDYIEWTKRRLESDLAKLPDV